MYTNSITHSLYYLNNVFYDVTPWLPQDLTQKFSPWIVSEDRNLQEQY